MAIGGHIGIGGARCCDHSLRLQFDGGTLRATCRGAERFRQFGNIGFSRCLGRMRRTTEQLTGWESGWLQATIDHAAKQAEHQECYQGNEGVSHAICKEHDS